MKNGMPVRRIGATMTEKFLWGVVLVLLAWVAMELLRFV